MSPRYVRARPSRRDELVAGLVAGALATGVGLVSFYLTRLLLSRRALEELEVVSGEAAEGGAR